MCAVYNKLEGQYQVLEWWVRACQAINSSGRVVKTVCRGRVSSGQGSIKVIESGTIWQTRYSVL